MPEHAYPAAVAALDVDLRKRSNYPQQFLAEVAGREKRALGDVFGLTNFGVNLTRLAPGGKSALRHSHARQDEFVYILAGTATLTNNDGDTQLAAGMCAGFKAGDGNAHQIANRSEADVLYLEVGDRLPGDTVDYPDVDLAAAQGEDGAWRFTHKDGSPY